MFSRITQSPTLVRVVPFAIFCVLTFLQDGFGEAARYWFYFAKTVAGAAMLLALFRHVAEMEWCFTWEAVLVGISAFALWVGLDGHYTSLGKLYENLLCPLLEKVKLARFCPAASAVPEPWNPNHAFGAGSGLAIFFILTRIAGSSLVVPMLEEVFYRSFVYRYLARRDFLSIPIGQFLPGSFIITAVFFGLAHHEWLAGILCGFAYQALVLWKKRLGDAITAHAITNLLLGLWIVWKGAWQFW